MSFKFHRDYEKCDDFFSLNNLYKKRIGGHQEGINCLEMSPSKHFLASAGDDKTVVLTNIQFKQEDPITVEKLTKKAYLAESHDFSIHQETIETPHVGNIMGMKYATESVLYTCGIDGMTCVYDLEATRCRYSYNTSSPCRKVDFDRINNLLLISSDEKISFYDERVSYRPIFKMDVPLSKAEFRQETYDILIGSAHNFMCLYDWRSLNSPLRSYILDPSPDGISDCKFNRYGNLIITTPHNCGPVIYSVDRSKKIAQCMVDGMNMVTYKSYRFGGPYDSYVLASFDSKSLHFWRLSPGREEEEALCANKMAVPATRELKTGSYRLKSFANKKSVAAMTRNDIKKMLEQKKEEKSRIEVEEYNYTTTTQKISRNLHSLTKSRKIGCFKSLINVAVMHPKIPAIFCGGVENSIYMFTRHYFGKDDEIEPNTSSVEYLDYVLDTM